LWYRNKGGEGRGREGNLEIDIWRGVKVEVDRIRIGKVLIRF
jgi:hypothetical protein